MTDSDWGERTMERGRQATPRRLGDGEHDRCEGQMS